MYCVCVSVLFLSGHDRKAYADLTKPVFFLSLSAKEKANQRKSHVSLFQVPLHAASDGAGGCQAFAHSSNLLKATSDWFSLLKASRF